ncbi:hypothetical protein ISF_06550 [Cordyceps fumosorosea ARSEF 2679]|uniref:Uncharacterized protein n=1 Tax=Cordyceps fumosorosea (strain ARSEF 2679) TaxID=1081104 RepID=A0A167RNE2_CORFA|nr:hypothetical protein ISF_06550 [Cordyceps fumosorosea ARSEF 2679]OAA58767.1 hypothetical protein ISF_06550 [Cordyceps fumosorosea ARSEF 2679]
MAGISASAFANGDTPVIKGHEQPRHWRMTDLHHAAHPPPGPAVSFPSQSSSTTQTQRSETASFSNEQQPCTPQRQTYTRPSNLTDSSEPRLLAGTPSAPPRTRQGSHDTAESTHNNTTSWTGLRTPDDITSPWQESTWSHYAGRLRDISYLQSPTVYTTSARARATRESSPAPSFRSRTPTTPGASTLSFLASKMAALKALASPSLTGNGCGDELIDLDIEATLFPDGAPQEGEVISPADYKNLQMNALGLLHRFQTTYQSQTIEFRTLKAEKEALEDEKSEAETRARHAKLQLDEVASKAAERGAALQTYIDELRRENIALMQDAHSPMIMTEDLGAEEDQANKRWRRSGDTLRSEHGSDTDAESVADASIFSRSRSPTLATAMSENGPVEPIPRSRVSLSATSTHTTPSQRPQQMTAFRKLMKGMSGDTGVRTVTECSNCQGQDASMAWDTASLMRDENRGLKMRVTELESALDDALDIVNGLELEL